MTLEKLVAYAANSFTLPDVCLRLREVLDDHRSDADDIARLISVDPSLTAKILKLANSALFRFPSQIDSISRAVNVVGGEALYNLSVAETANAAFKTFDSHLIDQEKHWNESVYCGMAAKYLARHVGLRGSERFFVTGILHNLSELVMAKYDADGYQQYLSEDSKLLPWEKQQLVFGFDFAHLSGLILERWQLPLPLFYPVRNLHNVQKQANEVDIALLACAQRVTIREKRQDGQENIDLFTPAIANSLDIEGEALGNAVIYANQETSKIASLIN
ncbi:HDOD domain-containing protein [Salinimonas sp. HHU 13199]|uniref:HDOD domain-containing protein n=1 Tax=Salinimonas profundi TaxID=2729140 RepID=A0ABR8LML3_9ALTE|nr:HDOD domain-containing protein [Salinimonas profundi]MBD3586530.1 HDOD domain-containing protein [Salinimonas profundi]